MSKTFVICDLDGTLCNIDHRLHCLEGKKDWDSFFDACDKDTPNVWCLEILRALNVEIIFVTGRPGSIREKTREWLQRFAFYCPTLYMRKDGDFREDSIVKKEIYDEHLADKNILFVLDDRRQVVDMWRGQGLVCLQCAEGEF